MKTIAVTVLVFVLLVLGYGYWQASTHAYLSLYFYDVSAKAQEGHVLNAQLRFFDEAGQVLAEGKTDGRFGILSLRHPTMGYCDEVERQAPFSTEAQQRWRDCFEAQTRWQSAWVPQLQVLSLQVGSCELARLPVVLTIYEDWWLWWLPVPHISGELYRSYSASLRLNSHACAPVPARQ